MLQTRKLTPEEMEIRGNIKALESEIRKLHNDLKSDQARWRAARRRQIKEGLQSGEVKIDQSWINNKVEQRLKIIRAASIRLQYFTNLNQSVAGELKKQTSLF